MRYFGSIQKKDGMLVISGVIGVRRFLWYCKRDAIVRTSSISSTTTSYLRKDLGRL